MKPIRISFPKILRIATIQKLTTISIGLLPLLACDVGEARGVKAPAGINLVESATPAADGLITEVEEFNQRIAAFNRDVLTLQKLENEIKNLTFQDCPAKESFERCTHNDLKNAFVAGKNVKINSYNSLARSLDLRKAALERCGARSLDRA